MRPKVIALFVMGLVCVISSQAQNNIQVIESKTEARFVNNKLETNLVIESSRTLNSAKITLKVLDKDNKVLAQNVFENKIKDGKQTLKKSLEFTKLQDDTEDLLWYRLQYKVVSADSRVLAKGIISLSEIMPEMFDLKVIASEEVFAGMKYRVHILTLHPSSKKPVKDVSITGFLKLDLDIDEKEDELNLKAVGKSNSEGFTSLDFEIPLNAKLDDDGDIIIKAVKNSILRETEYDLDIPTKSFVYLHTDKPIYQPNQKLFVRGLYLNPQKKPIADNELDIEISDEDGKRVYQETVKTSRFGIANLEWKIPKSIKLGKYKIEIENSNGASIGLAEFKITRYELPNFSVKAKADKSFYTPDIKKAKIKVSAEYLFGKPVTKGKVHIVQEEDSDLEEVEKQADKIDDKGNFSAEFDISEFHKNLEEEDYKYFRDIKFIAYFTDLTTNRTEQKRFDLRITKEPIHVHFIRYFRDANPNLPYQFYVSTFYADGTPISAKLTIEGNYKNIEPLKQLAVTKTNSYGASKIEIAIPSKPIPEANNQFNLTIKATDKKGNVGTFSNNIYVDENEKQIRIDSDKTIYKPDETIYLDLFSTELNDSIVVDVVDESGVIYSKIVQIKKGRGKTRIYYRPDFEGELTLSAYSLNKYDDYELLHHSKSIIFPKANKLDFKIKSLKTIYRPNEEAKINFKVRNSEGKGLETALGIIVLDKAIEERARIERLPDNYAGIRKLLGVADTFGNLTRRDLNNLDLEKRISKDFQLAAEFLLIDKSFRPNVFESDNYRSNFKNVYRDYFRRELKPLYSLLNKHYEKTGEFPQDLESLKEILSKNNFDFDSLQDAWGIPYRYEFDIRRDKLTFKILTASADKEFSTQDDFLVKTMEFNVFLGLTNRLNTILNNHKEEGKRLPETRGELIEIWKTGGFDLESFQDGWNHPLYIELYNYLGNGQKTVYKTIGNLDGEKQKIERIQVVKQKTILFILRSVSKDGIKDSKDDFIVGTFLGSVSEKIILDENILDKITKRKISNAKGGIGGTIMDAAGAVIPNADITLTNQDNSEKFKETTNYSGYFLIAGLPSGKYKLDVFAPGFIKTDILNLVITSMNLIEVEIYLDVGTLTSTVDVTSSLELVDTVSYSLASNVTKSNPSSIAGIVGSSGQKSTPRVREYFPETLVWKPEIITDKNGRAEVKFKLADSLTTWKFYAIASTQEGQIEMVERELQTFQPFFAELDPPKILTVGDEISLPVPVRNYTKKRKEVSVQMAKNTWSDLLNGSSRQIKINADSTTNAVFQFRAITPIENGKQRVTAIAKKEGDAIEKSVTVKPNGKEIINPQTKFFEKETTFELNFPAEAFPETKKTLVKIYPNMLSHVAESVEGLLKRPYGCGEQTTSSTYPNLMILRFGKGTDFKINSSLRKKAESYLQDGHKRLLNYHTDSGFGYWSGDKPDIALTAYVLQFLNDAKEFIKVDKNSGLKAERWLLKQQNADGSWKAKYSDTDLLTAYVARTLSITVGKDKFKKEALQKAFDYLKQRLPEINNSYILANFALAAIEIKNLQTAKIIIAKLTENKPLKSSETAFNGWGKTAEIETKALVVQALLKYKAFDENLNNEKRISEHLRFLLQNKDKYGVWYSTQTTVNVLHSLILFQTMQQQAKNGVQNKAEVLLNGVRIKQFEIDNRVLNNPLIIDISDSLNQTIRIDIKGFNSLAMAQVIATHYLDWNQTELDSRYFDLKVNYSKTNAEIGEKIICNVELKRKVGRYGMILAEIGTPPGADVDRAMLDDLVNSNKISRYDVLPDKVIVYLWARFDLKKFSFAFRPRYGINAQTSPSIVYDYYNEEAKATVAPMRFEVK